jgi:hypothetical protein
MRAWVLLPLWILAAGCTAIDHARLPPGGGDVFITSGDIGVPYQSLGLLQVTRRGARIFGFIDPVGGDLESGLYESLLPEARAVGADAVINVRFQQTQYLFQTKLLFALLFFVPLPSEVTVTGELVRYRAQSGGSGR